MTNANINHFMINLVFTRFVISVVLFNFKNERIGYVNFKTVVLEILITFRMRLREFQLRITQQARTSHVYCVTVN